RSSPGISTSRVFRVQSEQLCARSHGTGDSLDATSVWGAHDRCAISTKRELTSMKVAALAAAAALILAPAALARTTGTTLIAVDGPGFTLTLKEGAKTVTSLKAGTYSFKVEDKSNIHNFHLTGPGVNVKTSVGGVTSVTWKLKLEKGTYKYVCDPHATIMHGSFKVT